jgi:hypothetical protein
MEENATSEPLSTRSVGMQFGLYSAAVSSLVFLVTSFLGYNPFGGGLNYIGTVASIVLLVLAQKKFKDSGDGFMSYGQGAGIGFWCTLISVVITMAIMYIYINFVSYSPMQMMLEEQATKMQEGGTPDSAIETAQEWTKKLFWVFGIVGALIFGMIIALVVTIFTQKANPQAQV